MIWKILLRPRRAKDERVVEQDLDLLVAALSVSEITRHNRLEQVVAVDDHQRVEIVDPLPNMIATKRSICRKRRVERVGHDPALLEPAAEHQIMLTLVGAVLFDFRDQPMIVRPARLDRGQQASIAVYPRCSL